MTINFRMIPIVLLLSGVNLWSWQLQSQSSETLDIQEKQAEWLISTLKNPTTVEPPTVAENRHDALTIMKLLEKEAKVANLDMALTKMDQKENNRIHLLFKQVGFDELIAWLEQVRSSTGLTPDTVKLKRLKAAGTVEAIAVF